MSTELSNSMLDVLKKIIGQIDKRIVDDMSIDDLFKIDSEVAEVNSVFQTLQETKINELNISLPELKTQLETLVLNIQTKLDNNEFKGEKGYTPVKGTDYHDGVDGVSITKIENKDNKLVITDSNNKQYDLGNFTNDYQNLLNKPSVTDLDSYETGHWVPTCVSSDLAYSNCRYTRIGNKVFLCGLVTSFSNITSGDVFKLKGLPFQPSFSICGGTSMVRYSEFEANAVFVGSDASITFYRSINSTWRALYHKDLNNVTAEIYFSVEYLI